MRAGTGMGRGWQGLTFEPLCWNNRHQINVIKCSSSILYKSVNPEVLALGSGIEYTNFGARLWGPTLAIYVAFDYSLEASQEKQTHTAMARVMKKATSHFYKRAL